MRRKPCPCSLGLLIRLRVTNGHHELLRRKCIHTVLPNSLVDLQRCFNRLLNVKSNARCAIFSDASSSLEKNSEKIRLLPFIRLSSRLWYSKVPNKYGFRAIR